MVERTRTDSPEWGGVSSFFGRGVRDSSAVFWRNGKLSLDGHRRAETVRTGPVRDKDVER